MLILNMLRQNNEGVAVPPAADGQDEDLSLRLRSWFDAQTGPDHYFPCYIVRNYYVFNLLPRSYLDATKSRRPSLWTATRADVEAARYFLTLFDLVLITEWDEEERQRETLSSAFNFSRGIPWFNRKQLDSSQHLQSAQVQHIRDSNKFDIELYEFAKQLALKHQERHLGSKSETAE